ncbi:MAG: hypothetical protein IKC10_06885 [Alphaproteobacteria bacterium]|nr:hypothetical protein [Alphaproteobacteria bacterium]
MKKIFMLFLLFVVFNIVSCGKASLPVPYEDSGYPHSYPYNPDEVR